MDKEHYMYVGNLTYDITEEILWQLFGTVGKVEEVRIAKNSQGLFLGYAFVKMEKSEMVQKAIETLQGKEVNDRSIYLDTRGHNEDLWKRAFELFE